MKYIFLITSLLSSLFLCAQGTKNKFRAGITAGLTVCDIQGTDVRDNDVDFHKIGVVGGLIVNTDLNKKNIIQLEMNYLKCGSLQPPDSLNMGYSNISLSYIEIPVLIRHRVHFTMRKKPVDKLDVEAGVSYAKLLTQQAVTNNYVIFGTRSLYNENIANILLGVNYNITGNFYFSLRYSNSIIPAIKRNPLRLSNITYTFNNGNNMIFFFSFKYIFEVNQQKNIPKPDGQ